MTLPKVDSPTDSPEDVLYPMRLAARISGVSPATIRAWERRYAAVKPERTDGNTRMFRWQDVQRLSLLQRAANEGHAIRHLVDLNSLRSFLR